MTSSLSSSVIFVTLMSATIVSTAALSLSSRSSTSPVDRLDLSVHNILPSYRTEAKYCYQCAYSPPRSYSAGKSKSGVTSKKSAKSRSAADGGRMSHGGWDKCLGPFSDAEAKEYGVDVWKCRSYCYTRRDPNGDIFRGCYKGEYGVDPSLFGCHRQADSMYCFCEGDRCNHDQAPPEDDLKNFAL